MASGSCAAHWNTGPRTRLSPQPGLEPAPCTPSARDRQHPAPRASYLAPNRPSAPPHTLPVPSRARLPLGTGTAAPTASTASVTAAPSHRRRCGQRRPGHPAGQQTARPGAGCEQVRAGLALLGLPPRRSARSRRGIRAPIRTDPSRSQGRGGQGTSPPNAARGPEIRGPRAGAPRSPHRPGPRAEHPPRAAGGAGTRRAGGPPLTHPSSAAAARLTTSARPLATAPARGQTPRRARAPAAPAAARGPPAARAVLPPRPRRHPPPAAWTLPRGRSSPPSPRAHGRPGRPPRLPRRGARPDAPEDAPAPASSRLPVPPPPSADGRGVLPGLGCPGVGPSVQLRPISQPKGRRLWGWAGNIPPFPGGTGSGRFQTTAGGCSFPSEQPGLQGDSAPSPGTSRVPYTCPLHSRLGASCAGRALAPRPGGLAPPLFL